MKNRRTFLAALATGGFGLTFAAAPGDAQPTAAPASPGPVAPQPSAPPGAGAAASSTPKPPSAASRAIAEGMRSFDPSLTDDQVALIARRIEANRGAGPTLNPKDRPLHNGDEPVTHFAAAFAGQGE